MKVARCEEVEAVVFAHMRAACVARGSERTEFRNDARKKKKKKRNVGDIGIDVKFEF